MAKPLRVKINRLLAEHRRRTWFIGAVLPGLVAFTVGVIMGRGGDPLFMILLGVGVGATTIGILGMAGEFAHERRAPAAAIPAPPDSTNPRPVAITVVGDDDTITVNLFHLLTASWATTVDLPDGSSLVASTDGDTLEFRDDSTGGITRADVGASGVVSVRSAADVAIVVGALRALASQLLGSGLAYEPSVTVRVGSVPAVATTAD